MVCEKCGCHDRVIRTTTQQLETVRTRRCTACGHTIETREAKSADKPTKPRKKKVRPPKPDDLTQSQLNEPLTNSKPRGALEKALGSVT